MTQEPSRPQPWSSASARTIAALALASFAAALIAGRIQGFNGPWLWNIDLPKIDYPLASFYHAALAAGHLPLWNDQLGLGFPLYAEGQIGAFYPPNWLLFQLPPLVALDATRMVHLVVAGVGTGCLVLRLCGSRTGAFVAAATAVLGGAITTKLEWHNLVAAYAYLPWILLPLLRRPAPTRRGLVAAGVLFGVQALTGHPNTWLLTGLTASVVLIAISPRPVTLLRIAGFGALGVAVGAVQLIPTVVLTTLSVRSEGLSELDLFLTAATPFDVLGLGFQVAFVRVARGAWDPYTGWYPDGTFAMYEAVAYVGLPVVALAAVGAVMRRARPLLVAGIVLIAIPIAAAFRPEAWLGIPILNALRSPTRAYMVVALLLAVLAGMGVGRLGRSPGSVRRAAAAVAVLGGAYVAALVLVRWAPAIFDQLLLATSTFLAEDEVGQRRALAEAALWAAWPLALDVIAGLAIVGVVFAAWQPRLRRAAVPASFAVATVPLVLLGPLPNDARTFDAFSYAGGDFIQAIAAAKPYRVLTLSPPGYYAGMPDQLAAAGLADLRMFSSLDLAATTTVTDDAAGDDGADLRGALGVDVVVTFGRSCPGEEVGVAASEKARVCRVESRRPPYWITARAARLAPGPGSAIRPRDADLGVDPTIGTVPARVEARDAMSLAATIDAPADGWLWIDRSWWPAWQTSVDGRPVEVARAIGGQLVALPAGRHVVRQSFLPWDGLIGLAIGVVALVAAGAWLVRGARGSPRGT